MPTALSRRLINLARKLDKAEREALGRCAAHLKRLEQFPYAAETLTKMGDTKGLVQLHIDARHWEDVSRETRRSDVRAARNSPHHSWPVAMTPVVLELKKL